MSKERQEALQGTLCMLALLALLALMVLTNIAIASI
jgi:predicted nucleic acid-binding Zn ribbon protein